MSPPSLSLPVSHDYQVPCNREKSLGNRENSLVWRCNKQPSHTAKCFFWTSCGAKLLNGRLDICCQLYCSRIRKSPPTDFSLQLVKHNNAEAELCFPMSVANTPPPPGCSCFGSGHSLPQWKIKMPASHHYPNEIQPKDKWHVKMEDGNMTQGQCQQLMLLPFYG